MALGSRKPAMEAAASELRAIALRTAAGTLIGSEEAVLQQLGFSRSTVRQAARLIEQEGLLQVRRGINGGYYAARPDAGTIERTVSSYLETLEMDAEEVTAIASALWVEVVRKAATLGTDAARGVAEEFRPAVRALKPDASFAAVRSLEIASRKAIFDLVRTRYIELIFDINSAFATRRFPPHDVPANAEEHRAFVGAWRNAKLLELAAIEEGDVELGVMAAYRVRTVWHRRIWQPSKGAQASER